MRISVASVFSIILLIWVTGVLAIDDNGDDPDSPWLDEFEDEDLEIMGVEGVLSDMGIDPAEFLNLNGTPRGPVPDPTPVMTKPIIVISLSALTCRITDMDGGETRVYPIGCGVRDRKTKKSITPDGKFNTHKNAKDHWYYTWQRNRPKYFAGLPFLRLDIENTNGVHTYGMHGPITELLKRGYVSHGCIRMRGRDIKELFAIVYTTPGAPVLIQQEGDYDAFGFLYDVPYSFHESVSVPQPRVKLSRKAEMALAFDLPDSVSVGDAVTLAVQVSGSEKAAAKSVVFNENGIWKGGLTAPGAVNTIHTVSFATAGDRVIHAVILDANQNPIGHVEDTIIVH